MDIDIQIKLKFISVWFKTEFGWDYNKFNVLNYNLNFLFFIFWLYFIMFCLYFEFLIMLYLYFCYVLFTFKNSFIFQSLQ